MSKQPTRLASFPIPREQAPEPESAPTDQPANVPTLAQAEQQTPVPAAQPATLPATAPPSPLPPVLAAQQVITPVPLPATEQRKQVGARIRLSVAERLRAYQFYSREEQQDIVETAIDQYLRGKGF